MHASDPNPVPRCLSVVMPCFNEVGTIATIMQRVLASPLVAELIVVDDASTDGTGRAAAEAGTDDPRVRVIAHTRNRGKGAALRTGIAAAGADYVIVQDADLEYDPADFAALVAPALAGRAEVIYGSRFCGRRSPRSLHTAANRLLTWASNLTTGLALTDMETCYKLFPRTLIQGIDLREDGFGFEPEVTAKIARAGATVAEVPISYAGRTHAEGKKIGWRDGVRSLYAIGRYGVGIERRAGRRRLSAPRD